MVIKSRPVLLSLHFITGYIYEDILKRCDILAAKLHKDANVTKLTYIYGFYLKTLKYDTQTLQYLLYTALKTLPRMNF